ncbi:methyl-accepting chemotaxis protein [Kosakonia sp. MUSA4]|uniref:methyl-accepting chemotaxis protein n=1 Tax=Kosakonia sp. MUSA4 TaxID=2067958 RepID=UPI00159812CC|nr:methyl-accepting chemotaxis protein [Kosakonia sp. MUSA4]QJT82296.1 methyl-accepting chemotaxis protein [Kosakonia sp. MUSA4]
MTVTQRLLLTFSLLSASLVALVIVMGVVLSGFQSRFQYVQEKSVPSIIALDELIANSKGLTIWLYRHYNAGGVGGLSSIENTIDGRLNLLNDLNSRYEKNYVVSKEDKALTENAFRILKEIRSRLPEYLAASRAHSNAIAMAALQGSDGIGASILDLQATYDGLRQLNLKVAADYRKYNDRIYHQTRSVLISVSAAIILLLGFFTLRTILLIRKQLNGMRHTMETASENLDLTLRADVLRYDEIGLTASAFNHLIEKVSVSLVAVGASAQSVGTTSAQISTGNEELSSRTEAQASSLEQTAASMSELSETVRQTAENTRQAGLLAKNAHEITEDSTAQIRTMLATMSDIRESSSKITSIITLIEGIAFQTNILALNAAVEAARAGEQGRGFAVVAGEVRNLAQRSSSSAREIRELIESSLSFIQIGSEQAESVGQNIIRMNDAARQVNDLVDEIAIAAREQSQGISQIHIAVNQMDEATQQNAALVEEASASSLSLKEQAVSLSKLVSAFTIFPVKQ